MKITYDPTVDALYIRFQETSVTTQHVTDAIALDYDTDGHLAGIEILDYDLCVSASLRLCVSQPIQNPKIQNLKSNQSLYGSNSSSPAIATPSGRSVCRIRRLSAWAARTARSGR